MYQFANNIYLSAKAWLARSWKAVVLLVGTSATIVSLNAPLGANNNIEELGKNEAEYYHIFKHITDGTEVIVETTRSDYRQLAGKDHKDPRPPQGFKWVGSFENIGSPNKDNQLVETDTAILIKLQGAVIELDKAIYSIQRSGGKVTITPNPPGFTVEDSRIIVNDEVKAMKNNKKFNPDGE